MLFQPGLTNAVYSLGTKILGELNFDLVYHAKKLGLDVFFRKNAVSLLASIDSQNNSGTPCLLGKLEEFGC